MATTAERIRNHRGIALLSGGFRPFFLFGAIWAALVVALWLPVFEGRVELPTALDPIRWHVHELLYGWLGAAIGGFILTAVPNWTGRLPVAGTPLALLVGLWIAGRSAIFFSGAIGLPLAAAIDLAYPVALIGVVAREVTAGRNWRNLRVVAVLGLFLAGDVAFLLEATRDIGFGHGTRLGIASAVLLVSLIGGRIVPSFTANWLRPRGPGRMPVPFGRFDGAVMAATAVALLSWIALPEAKATGALFLLAGVLHGIRVARWAGWRTAPEAMLLVLHLAYLSIPLGFLALGAGLVGLPAPAGSAALHAWTIGTTGMMTLAVMTRASLGHTGHVPTAGRIHVVIYTAVGVALLARVAVGFGIAEFALLHLAVAGWLVAFGGFVVAYARLLLARRS
jgi:uncharacterized protein involved in response to NO